MKLKKSKTKDNKKTPKIHLMVTSSYSEKFGDGVRLGMAHVTVTRPNNPPLTVGDGVRLLWALWPHGHHPPVVDRPSWQTLFNEEVPLTQAGDADRRLQDHLQNKQTKKGLDRGNQIKNDANHTVEQIEIEKKALN